MLVSALSLTPATASSSSSSEMMVDGDGNGNGNYFSFIFAMIVTMLCATLGYVVVLRKELHELRGERSQNRWNDTLMKVLGLLKGQKRNAEELKSEGAEEEHETDDEHTEETPQERYERYQQSSLDEVSNPDLWQLWHHGTPSINDGPSAHRQYADGHINQMMRDTNDLLRRRMERLETEYDAASTAGDIELMESLDSQINECSVLMYNIE